MSSVVRSKEHGSEVHKSEELPSENSEPAPVETPQQLSTGIPPQADIPPVQEQPKLDLQPISRKVEVPNGKVGVLIGKAGDTIRYLQYNSGAKIQIARDADADPHASTRPVELIGTLENINKAEQLIKDVIAEADAGGSPALVAGGFGTAQSGGEQVRIQVPNDKENSISDHYSRIDHW
ncbi:far upstream element-binding protein 1-like [Amborella trichopoda]|uniref:far upstream element-binding protein 1-like n=1 Tax=Amborella trichopoda TaxID=13333 RepID=UPI0009BE0812|nr:far upstream element-binding protein 1-like [Amborella trichopoda]XP_020519058.1 far upstream element-binding protein 1-like [Amborella trichopoda]|eukprot:XP_020519057.1 far upstream element-binding protein 1-like [Amborella trichopoda]